MLALLALLALTAGRGPDPTRPGGTAVTLPAPALSGPTWTLASLSLGGAPITPGRLLTRPSFRLSGPSLTVLTLTGTTGCSPLTARVRVRGQHIAIRDIDPGPSDRCPDHALALREDFVALLGSATRYERQGTALTVSGPLGLLKFSCGGGALPELPGH